MHTRQLVRLTVAAGLLAATPFLSLHAEETPDTIVQTLLAEMTVDGKPATPAQKSMAKEMVRQATAIGQKAAQTAVTAMTDPKKAEQMSHEVETMGDQLKSLGDSLQALSEDTTFFYEGDDTVSPPVTASSIRDFVNGVKDGFNDDDGYGGWKPSSMSWLESVIAILFVVLVLFLLASPLWIVLIVIWLIYRSYKKHEETIQKAVEHGQPVPPSIFSAPEGTDTDLWRKGMNQLAWGVGLCVSFVVLGSRLLFAIGLILGCLGGSKLLLANRQGKQKGTASEPPATPGTPAGNADPMPGTDIATRTEAADTTPEDTYDKGE